MESIEEHLKPNGVLVSNLISSLIGDTSDLLRAEYKTANKVFSHIYLFYTRTSSMSQVQNIILIGSLNQTQYSKADLIEMAKYTPKRNEKLAEYASTYFDNEVRTKELPILTDDYAPAQSLLNPITGATYEGGDTIFPRSTISPILIAGVWILTLASLYFMSTKIRTGIKHVKV
jgi:hypothetical protein